MPTDLTTTLRELAAGDTSARERLLRAAYEQLHAIAEGFLARERPGHTLQPTALVHEAYLRLIDQTTAQPGDRVHFIGAAAHAMRHVLIDHARRRNADKRGGGRQRVSLDTALLGVFESGTGGGDILSLHDALEKLEMVSSLTLRVVELRYFGGLTIDETGAELGISASSVEREWRFARAWLREKLDPGANPSAES